MRIPFRTTDAEAQIVAVRQGLGMTTLPCFVGDADPLLVRVPGTDLHMYGTVWLLTQGETRKTKRVRLFTEFGAVHIAQLTRGRSPATLTMEKCRQADIPSVRLGISGVTAPLAATQRLRDITSGASLGRRLLRVLDLNSPFEKLRV